VVFASTSIGLVLTVFLGIMLVASILSIKGRIPYTVVLVFIGIALTVTTASLPFPPSLQYAFSQIRSMANVLIPQGGQGGGQVGGLFVGLVVPPLIFEAMMHIRSKDLRAVLRPAFFLATIGVGIATVITGLVIWQATPLSLAAAFLFAAIISPTDTATVIEIFRRLKVPSRLSSMLELEAAFNDATAIVIFALVLGSLTAAPRFPIFGALGSFVVTFGGGALIGILVAFISELLHSLISDNLSETVLSIFAVYGSYTLATGFGFSGLIAVTIVGLYFGNLTARSTMTPATRETIAVFWQIAAFVGNSIAFLFIGLETQLSAIVPALGLIALAYITVTSSRAAAVYPILAIFSRVGEKIPVKWMNVATLGGMRGALSIALGLSLTTTTTAIISSSQSSMINAMVLGVAFISILAQGTLLYRYVQRKFKVELASNKEEDEQEVNVKLAKTVGAIENLQNLRKQNQISEEEFDAQLHDQLHELHDLHDERAELEPTEAIQEPSKIVKSRATSLYSILGSSVENAGDDLFNKPKQLFARKRAGNGKENTNIENDENKENSENQHATE
jgi:CPA1 family monovalent cation:H+ antiporter